MTGLKSSVLIIKKELGLENIFGADVSKNLSHALAIIEKNSYSSVVIDLETLTADEAFAITQKSKFKNPNSQILIIRGNTSVSELQKISNNFQIFKIHTHFQQDLLSYDIQESLAEYDLNKQNFDLLKIIEDQNTKLRQITEDLETRVSARTLSLAEIKKTLIHTTQYYQTLVSAFIAIQKAESIIDLEKNLSTLLREPLDITWVRIFIENTNTFSSDRKKDLQTQTIYEKPLLIEKRKIGDFALARSSKKPFSKEELKLLKQITHALSLGLDRLLSQERADYIRSQWQSTFDAIVDPVALINSDNLIVQTNKAFDAISTTRDFKAYAEQPDIIVTSQLLEDTGETKIYINHYKDISEQKKTERQILESSKLSNLGLIGSSIAHEINNPLAGLITFIQILKQDMESSAEKDLIGDISDMEVSALRCKEIVNNLLSFTRMGTFDKSQIHLSDVVNKAIRVLHIKTKPIGCVIGFTNHCKDDRVLGVENSLSQSLVNILQNSLDSVLERKKVQKDHIPWIEVELSNNASEIHLDIKDNGIGIGKNDLSKVFSPFFSTKNPEQHRGLGLTISYQIIREHSGVIDLTSLSENLTRARITFQRPVL